MHMANRTIKFFKHTKKRTTVRDDVKSFHMDSDFLFKQEKFRVVVQ